MSINYLTLQEFKQQHQTLLPNYTMIPSILTKIDSRLQDALKIRKRVFVMRMDVHLPSSFPITAITQFMKLFIQKESRKGYAPSYICVREYSVNFGLHYHVVLFLNGYKTHSIGAHIANARSVLKSLVSFYHCTDSDFTGYIHPCDENGRNGIMVYRDTLDDDLAEVYRQLSYLAKTDQKTLPHPGHLKQVFGSSHRRQPHYINAFYGTPKFRFDYTRRKINTLLNQYLDTHEHLFLVPLFIHLPVTYDRKKIISQWLRRVLDQERHKGQDPCYFCIHSTYCGTIGYYFFLVLNGTDLCMPYSHQMDASRLLNYTLGVTTSDGRYSNQCEYLCCDGTTDPLLFHRSDNSAGSLSCLSLLLNSIIDHRVELAGSRSFLCSTIPSTLHTGSPSRGRSRLLSPEPDEVSVDAELDPMFSHPI